MPLGGSPNRRSGAGALSLAAAYVGSVAGAGFASGQEHLRFFLGFGVKGLLGVVVAGAMLALFGAHFLEMARRRRTRSYRELFARLAPPSLRGVVDLVFLSFLFVSLAVMMAGSAALFGRHGADPLVGAAAMGVCTLAIVALDPEPMLRVNGAITAALALFIFGVGAASAPEGLARIAAGGLPANPPHAGWIPQSWLGAALLYGVYNLVLSFALFASLGAGIASERASRWGGMLGGGILTLLGLGVCFAVAAGGPQADAGELPMEAALERFGPEVRAAYAGALWAAMLTTAVASGYALARRAEERGNWSRGATCALLVAAALPFTSFGFARLVATFYPLVGYVGSACILFVAARHTRT